MSTRKCLHLYLGTDDDGIVGSSTLDSISVNVRTHFQKLRHFLRSSSDSVDAGPFDLSFPRRSDSDCRLTIAMRVVTRVSPSTEEDLLRTLEGLSPHLLGLRLLLRLPGMAFPVLPRSSVRSNRNSILILVFSPSVVLENTMPRHAERDKTTETEGHSLFSLVREKSG